MGRGTRTAAVALSVFVLAAGCGTGNESGGAPSSPANAPGLGSGGYQLLDNRNDLDGLHPVVWSAWESVDETTIRVFFPAGPRDCYAAAPTVEETNSAVFVHVRVGMKPGSGECTADARHSAVDISLTRALGERVVEPFAE